jgi:membrane protease subunit HflC
VTDSAAPRPSRWRFIIAGSLALLALAAATAVPVTTGSAAVITRFGKPVTVQVEPGLTWKAPPPIDRIESVDLRVRTTSSGVHSVLTRDGLSLLVQVWVAWQVPPAAEPVLRFVRATRNNPDDAANQLRTFLSSSLETVTGRFELDVLLNTDPGKLQMEAYCSAIRERITAEAQRLYGIDVVQIGVERLMIPETTVAATVSRMATERDTVAEEKKAHGRKVAGEIRASFDKEARVIKATAEEEAARIEATARTKAAAIYGTAHAQDPRLYRFLRSLDTLDLIISNSTRLVVRTDAAPFDAMVELPGAARNQDVSGQHPPPTSQAVPGSGTSPSATTSKAPQP